MTLTWKNNICLWRVITSDFKGTRDFVACNHLRSYKYYADSILNPDGFAGFPCASYSDFSAVSTLFLAPEGFCDHRFSWLVWFTAHSMHSTNVTIWLISYLCFQSYMFILIVIRQGETLEKWTCKLKCLCPPCSLSLLCVLGKCENLLWK